MVHIFRRMKRNKNEHISIIYEHFSLFSLDTKSIRTFLHMAMFVWKLSNVSAPNIVITFALIDDVNGLIRVPPANCLNVLYQRKNEELFSWFVICIHYVCDKFHICFNAVR